MLQGIGIINHNLKGNQPLSASSHFKAHSPLCLNRRDETHYSDFGLGLFVLALAFGIIARQIHTGALSTFLHAIHWLTTHVRGGPHILTLSPGAGARMAHYNTSKRVLELLSRFPYTVFVLLLGFICGSFYAFQKNA